jgi:hypothetical protein
MAAGFTSEEGEALRRAKSPSNLYLHRRFSITHTDWTC